MRLDTLPDFPTPGPLETMEGPKSWLGAGARGGEWVNYHEHARDRTTRSDMIGVPLSHVDVPMIDSARMSTLADLLAHPGAVEADWFGRVTLRLPPLQTLYGFKSNQVVARHEQVLYPVPPQTSRQWQLAAFAVCWRPSVAATDSETVLIAVNHIDLHGRRGDKNVTIISDEGYASMETL